MTALLERLITASELPNVTLRKGAFSNIWSVSLDVQASKQVIGDAVKEMGK